jgi:hypothetical protein
VATSERVTDCGLWLSALPQPAVKEWHRNRDRLALFGVMSIHHFADGTTKLASETSRLVEPRCINHAGEVGDGPDQGHSGGADSVPPAPNCPLVIAFLDQEPGAEMIRNRAAPTS